MSQWNITYGVKIIVETACDGYFGEVQTILTAPAAGNFLSLSISAYSTTRLAIPQFSSQTITIAANTSCFCSAGTQSSNTNCDSSILVGTSNTIQHENTSIGLIKFQLPTAKVTFQKTVLKLNVEEVVGKSDIRLQVLGVISPNSDWNQTFVSWSSMSSLSNGIQWLTPLASGNKIDRISKNFINWASLSNIFVVGHVSMKNGDKNQTKIIDVTDYVKSVANVGSSSISFLLYRPFVHPSYNTTQ